MKVPADWVRAEYRKEDSNEASQPNSVDLHDYRHRRNGRFPVYLYYHIKLNAPRKGRKSTQLGDKPGAVLR